MNYMNKLVGLSLIMCAAFSSCSDEMENGGGGSETNDNRMRFTVSLSNPSEWTNGNHTRSVSDSSMVAQASSPVEMKGKVDGKSVYLTTEVTKGFPDMNRQATKGTIVSSTDEITSFGMSATTNKSALGIYDYMDKVKVIKDGMTWTPEGDWYWPYFYLGYSFWYPFEAKGFKIEYEDKKMPRLYYEAPDMVTSQVPILYDSYTNVKDISSIAKNSTIGVELSPINVAVKFVVGDDLAACTIQSISIKGVKYKGYYQAQYARDLNGNGGTSSSGGGGGSASGGGSTTVYNPLWTVDDDTKDFTLTLDKELDGTAGTAITAEDQTFFMIPQVLETNDNATIEIIVNNGVADFTLSAKLKDTDSYAVWEGGSTYTYKISHDFDDLTVSNEEFVAYTDSYTDVKDQLAFYVRVSATSSTREWSIYQTDQGSELTVSPSTFSSDGTVIPIKIASWTGMDAVEPTEKTTTLYISPKNSADVVKTIKVTWKAPDQDGPFWLYSVTETASQPVGSDVLALENASQSDWIAMTASANYDIGNAYTQDTYYNPQGNDFYLQTIGATKEDRFASLLATKAAGNVMYCVQQKAITADFGFKNCARNISRESEKWNIVLSGGRFKQQSTSLEAKLVISDDVPDSQINSSGRNLTGGGIDAVTVQIDKTTATGVSIQKYVKKRWDTGANNTTNNGTRKVNVKIQDGSYGWYDVAGTGTMADRDTWGTTYMLGRGEYHAAQADNKYDKAVEPIFRDYFEVHKQHPFFGVGAVSKNWACFSDNNSTNIATNPVYMVYSAVRGLNGATTIIYNHNSITNWSGGSYIMIQANSYNDYINGRVKSQGGNNGGIFARYSQKFYDDPNRAWRLWTEAATCANIPVIYKSRPTDTAPIIGTSVNE